MHFSGQLNCWSLRCSLNIASRRCSNYIFIIHLTLGFNILRKDNCMPRPGTFKIWDLVRLILEILRYFLPQRLEQRAYELFQETSSGKFLDPNQNPTDILEEMTRIRDEFYSVQSQMTQASAWKQAITGEPYELDYLHQMAVQMDIRQELWKYIEVSTHEIADWKRQLFRKVEIS